MSAVSDLEARLQEGVAALGVGLPEAAPAQLLGYLRLLERWNRAFNLTAVRDPAAMVPRHLLDSLAVLPWVRGERVLDVGSGAGLPGIPLAVARPQWQFVLLDSNGKKTRFLTQVVGELGLTNVEVLKARAEDHRPFDHYATIVSRAFASLATFLDGVAGACGPETRVLAMKGAYPAAELDGLERPWARLQSVERLTVPGTDGERHLVVFACTPAPQMQ